MTTAMTMKRITAGIVSLALVCTMGLAPIQDNGEVSGFSAPAVITASAASSKLTGEHRIYVTTLNPIAYAKKKAEIVVKMNTNDDIKKIANWCSKLSVGTSGCGNASKVVKYGKELVSLFDIKGGGILFFFEKGFSNLNGVSKSAKAAASDINNLHKKYPKNGITLRIKQSGAWDVSIQGKAVVDTPVKPIKLPKCSSKYKSIVDALKSIKVDSSFSYRKKLYERNFGRKDYSGTSKENLKLLNALKAGSLIKV